jgi:serine protease Do
VLVWAETGRTDGLKGTLGGLSGAPALDDQGRVVGVTIAEAPRRGRIYTTSPETTARALAVSGRRLADAPATPISADNYGRVADDLRRNLRVAQVVCLTA